MIQLTPQVLTTDLERPSTKGLQTNRGLSVDLPYNKGMLSKLSKIVDSVQGTETFFDDKFEVIEDVNELKKLLSEVLIRFDTNPQYYTKKDYGLLLSILYRTLLYLYSVSQISSDNEDVLVVDITEDEGAVLRPQLGELEEAHEQEDADGNITISGTTHSNNEKRIATIGDIRNYINNKLTWIKYE